jgi:orotate phosphoribosyltransferase
MGPASGLARLRELLQQRSIVRGDFVLASGRRATFYIDARCTTMSGEGLALIGALGLERLAARGWAPQLVGGLTLGADPVAWRRRDAGARSTHSACAGRPRPMALRGASRAASPPGRRSWSWKT